MIQKKLYVRAFAVERTFNKILFRILPALPFLCFDSRPPVLFDVSDCLPFIDSDFLPTFFSSFLNDDSDGGWDGGKKLLIQSLGQDLARLIL